MPNVFDRAEGWRRRAEELRVVAEQMEEASARHSLRVIACSLEAHARKLEEVTLKVRNAGYAARVERWRRAG